MLPGKHFSVSARGIIPRARMVFYDESSAIKSLLVELAACVQYGGNRSISSLQWSFNFFS